jgi:hypothetical protein
LTPFFLARSSSSDFFTSFAIFAVVAIETPY